MRRERRIRRERRRRKGRRRGGIGGSIEYLYFYRYSTIALLSLRRRPAGGRRLHYNLLVSVLYLLSLPFTPYSKVTIIYLLYVLINILY